jgi:hypothetical protein
MCDLVGFLYGALGGLLAELLGLFELRRQAPQDLPRWLKSPFYWVITVLMICAGGLLVIVYLESDIPLKPILSVNVGASAPLLIRAFISQTPPINPGRLD